jgi:hypothetical protein
VANGLLRVQWGELVPGPYAVSRPGLFGAGALSVADFGANPRSASGTRLELIPPNKGNSEPVWIN